MEAKTKYTLRQTITNTASTFTFIVTTFADLISFSYNDDDDDDDDDDDNDDIDDDDDDSTIASPKILASTVSLPNRSTRNSLMRLMPSS